MPDWLKIFGLALGLGLLVGWQRQRAAAAAGFRTFPLATLLGALCARLSGGAATGGSPGWMLPVGLAGIVAILGMARAARNRSADPDPGITTEVALLVMYGVGALLAFGDQTLAVVLAGVVAVLLHLKPELHSLAARIGDRDFRAMMQFVVLALVILPVLPDRALGPFGAFNPHRIWRMVVLLTGISLGGYVAYKLLGRRAGTLAAGLLGGLISSTATTVGFARRSRSVPETMPLASAVILLASAVSLSRVLLLVALTDPTHWRQYAVYVAPLLLLLLGVALFQWWRLPATTAELPEPSNPTELRSALVFTALYTGVLLGVAYAREAAGERGLYLVAGLSGLTDMDAITLSSARLAREGTVTSGLASRLVVVGILANLVFKGSSAVWLGGRPLWKRVAVPFLVVGLAGLGLLLGWPGSGS